MAGGVCIAVKMVKAGRLAHRAAEECATELNLAPLGVLIRQPSTAEVTAAANKPARAQLASQERIGE